MVHRIATGLLILWTAGMALGILAAFLGIGRDCAGLSGAELTDCQGGAWIRGGVGLALLLFLWFIVAIPIGLVWSASRPQGNVVVVGPDGQQVTLSEGEAAKRVMRPGWSYLRAAQGEVRLRTG